MSLQQPLDDRTGGHASGDDCCIPYDWEIRFQLVTCCRCNSPKSYVEHLSENQIQEIVRIRREGHCTLATVTVSQRQVHDATATAHQEVEKYDMVVVLQAPSQLHRMATAYGRFNHIDPLISKKDWIEPPIVGHGLILKRF